LWLILIRKTCSDAQLKLKTPNADKKERKQSPLNQIFSLLNIYNATFAADDDVRP
jgi:hypothetical protein